MVFKASLVSALLLLGQTQAALQPIVMKGTKFYYQNGTQFFIKGVAYQQDSAAAGQTSTSTTYTDPLADEAACTRDVPLLQQLGTNTIRTYAIDPTANHDACMKLLDAAGIYVISDLSEPALSINRDDPKWDVELYTRYTSVVKTMSQYSNVIGFFAGNEVTNNKTNTPASAFVKAAVRDTKAYIAANVNRWMGVGYAANDDADIRADIAHYFNCGNQSQAIDFWGYNIYEWCGQSTFESSGYKTQVDFFQNYSIPVFFAEYGCNNPGGAAGRIWQETDALYSSQMTGVISGGIVYMYFQEANDFGLVSVSGSSATTLKDFAPLATKIATANPTGTSSDAYTPTNSPASCPDVGAAWAASGNSLPPTPDETVCDCMFKSLSCVPSSSATTSDYKTIFDYICTNDQKACGFISANTTTGVYGPYSMCNDTQKLGALLDAYYKNQNKASTACDFKGKASVVSGASAASSCTAALSSASSAASVAATATVGSNTASGSGSSKSSNIAVPIPMKNLLTVGDMAIGAYLVVAMVVGGGMVLL
ncbi:hypothetical protein GQ53DRAFT_666032 [Thozetella sp. PMI_491]|nr:hypothetical protein GQ53DRAFT_666032 [Thozetella sp. PMI_491]